MHRLIQPKKWTLDYLTEMQSDQGLYDSYKIVFERRMRSKEIHYIDHPLVGLVVLATPFKLGKEEPIPAVNYKTL